MELFTFFLRALIQRNHIYKWCMPSINVYVWQCFEQVWEILIDILLNLWPDCFPAQKYYPVNTIKHTIPCLSCFLIVLEEGSKGAGHLLWPSTEDRIHSSSEPYPVLHAATGSQQWLFYFPVCCSWIMLINNWFCIRIKWDFPPDLNMENHIPLLEACGRMWGYVPQHCFVPS